MSTLDSIPGMRARVLTVMATREQDQALVVQAAIKMGINDRDADMTAEEWRHAKKIVPCFGWHPWFSHQMYDEEQYDGSLSLSNDQKVLHYQSVLTPKSEDRDFLLALPDPRPFSHLLDQTRMNLQRFPLALIGEVGLDKAFRIPEVWLPEQQDERNDTLTPGGREGRRLSPYRVAMDHQQKVLLAQLRLAGELGRAVSCHGVQAHGIVYNTVSGTWKGHERNAMSKKERKKIHGLRVDNQGLSDTAHDGPKPYPPRLCLHSYSGPTDPIKQYLDPKVPVDIFFSFSSVINFGNSTSKSEEVIRAVPSDRILIESDLHTAGDRMDGYLEEIIRKVCDLKGWTLEEGVTQLARNWKRFVFGTG